MRKCWHLHLGINLRCLGFPSRAKKELLAEDVIPNAALMLLAGRKSWHMVPAYQELPIAALKVIQLQAILSSLT